MGDKVKKVLIIDDSALMRRIICDIIATDEDFEVADMAADGEEGLSLLRSGTYDIVVLDIVMPKADGLTVLRRMKHFRHKPPVIVFSSEVKNGAEITIKALELGAFDFIEKPESIMGAKKPEFTGHFLETIRTAVESQEKTKHHRMTILPQLRFEKKPVGMTGEKLVAIASSTGGPRALQKVIPQLPAGLDAPVLIVQHMPAGFTTSLAQRLDELSALKVVEAEDGMRLEKGTVYLARGGLHMEVAAKGGIHTIRLRDGAPREGVKPCANFMYESLADSGYDSIVCSVLTGMGQDGTAGIGHLKSQKKIYTITQDEKSSVVYGMPRAAYAAGLADQVEPVEKIADAITKIVGVK